MHIHTHTRAHTHASHADALTHAHTSSHTCTISHMHTRAALDLATHRYFKKAEHKDVPLYPKYILTQETIQYLKKPTFDIWHWEPNEMLCLLEHMYNESLGQ